MALPNQKIFSIDDAARWIQSETGNFCSYDGLLQLAKNNQIYISFLKQDWEYVRTDEASYEMENVHCMF